VSTEPAQHPPDHPDHPEMVVVVNGARETLPDGATLEALLERLALAGQRVAVARNGEVVPRSRFGQETLAAGDQVEILEAVGGG
jgi:sulfur carrier protein